MNRKLFKLILIGTLILLLAGCNGNGKERVVLYSSGFDYENEYYSKRLQEQFPDYEIVVEYLTTGNHAAKLKAEGVRTEADISLGLEYMYLETMKDNLADLSEYDFSVFADDLIDEDYKFLPAIRNSGSIILNTDMLENKGLVEPQSYADLLNPEYKDLISIPSPKSSGTGYSFVKSLVNAWGEEEALTYFDKLSDNVLQYTSSGSGPLNALIQGEVAIAMGMTAQIVDSINSGLNFKIVFFEEGAPYNAYGHSIIRGKETRTAVKEVFDFFYTDLIAENNEKFYPELVFKGKINEIENYPKDIQYSDMNNNTSAEKEKLMDKWDN